MRIPAPRSRTGVALLLAASLLVTGLAVETQYARPLMERVTNLQIQRQEARGRLRQQEAVDARGEQLAARLGYESLDQIGAPAEVDPMGYLGDLLERHGLIRLDLRNRGSQAFPDLLRTDLNLFVIGEFGQIQSFMQDLESGRRLASIETFTITTRRGADNLEGRFNISIYDPTGGATP